MKNKVPVNDIYSISYQIGQQPSRVAKLSAVHGAPLSRVVNHLKQQLDKNHTPGLNVVYSIFEVNGQGFIGGSFDGEFKTGDKQLYFKIGTVKRNIPVTGNKAVIDTVKTSKGVAGLIMETRKIVTGEKKISKKDTKEIIKTLKGYPNVIYDVDNSDVKLERDALRSALESDSRFDKDTIYNLVNSRHDINTKGTRLLTSKFYGIVDSLVEILTIVIKSTKTNSAKSQSSFAHANIVKPEKKRNAAKKPATNNEVILFFGNSDVGEVFAFPVSKKIEAAEDWIDRMPDILHEDENNKVFATIVQEITRDQAMRKMKGGGVGMERGSNLFMSIFDDFEEVNDMDTITSPRSIDMDAKFYKIIKIIGEVAAVNEDPETKRFKYSHELYMKKLKTVAKRIEKATVTPKKKNACIKPKPKKKKA